MKQPPYILETGTPVKINPTLGEPGFWVNPLHVQNRAPRSTGNISGVVPGHGGDVYFVTHEGGHVAAYDFSEFELDGPEVGTWVRPAQSMAQCPGDRFQIAEIVNTSGIIYYRRQIGESAWSCMLSEIKICPEPSPLHKLALEARRDLAACEMAEEAFARADRERETLRIARTVARVRRAKTQAAFKKATSLTALLEEFDR